MRTGSKGLVVAGGWDPPSSAVVDLPRIMAPASRSAHTAALSRSGKLPRKASQPICVRISLVSSRSLMPMGIPSMAERAGFDKPKFMAVFAHLRPSPPIFSPGGLES